MRFRPFRLLLWLGLMAPCAVVLVIFLAFDQRPRIERTAEFTPDNIARAKRIVETNDPRRLRSGAVRTVTVTAEDLDLAVNYLTYRAIGGSATATMDKGRLHLRLSVPARLLPFSPFVNLEASLVQGAPLPVIDSVHMGQLPIPASLVRYAVARAMAMAFSSHDQDTVAQAVKAIVFEPEEARFTYQWHADLADTVRGAFMRPADRDRLEQFQRTLADTAEALPRGAVSLTALIRPLFARAAERSRTSDPVTENRAAIFVLTTYVLGLPLRDVVPEAAEWPRPRRHPVTLNDRDDSAKHFMVSAMLAANAGGPFADAVGLYKEVSDSRGGSGFSFNDLAADHAGTRLGQQAEGVSSAARLQSRLAVLADERAIMPNAADLPESMTEPEFKRRFGGIDAPAYTRMIAEIDSRIGALAAYR